MVPHLRKRRSFTWSWKGKIMFNSKFVEVLAGLFLVRPQVVGIKMTNELLSIVSTSLVQQISPLIFTIPTKLGWLYSYSYSMVYCIVVVCCWKYQFDLFETSVIKMFHRYLILALDTWNLDTWQPYTMGFRNLISMLNIKGNYSWEVLSVAMSMMMIKPSCWSCGTLFVAGTKKPNWAEIFLKSLNKCS